MAREYFKVFHSYLKSIEPLNDAERGRLFTAMLEYSITGVEPDIRGNERYIFPTMKANLDREIESYSHTVEKNSVNGKKGGRPVKTQKTQWVFQKATESQKSQDKEKDKDKEEDKDKKKMNKRKNQPFSPPTLEEVKAYCKERNSCVNPKRFFDYFEAGGWVDGKGNPVLNWKQKLITWETHSNAVQPKETATASHATYDLGLLDSMDLMTPPEQEKDVEPK